MRLWLHQLRKVTNRMLYSPIPEDDVIGGRKEHRKNTGKNPPE